MARKTVYTCDRCLIECLGVSIVDTGNDYSEGRGDDGLKKRVTADLCVVCLKALRDFMKPLSSDKG